MLSVVYYQNLIFQMSSRCYPIKIGIEFDLKDFECESKNIQSSLDLNNKIEILN